MQLFVFVHLACDLEDEGFELRLGDLSLEDASPFSALSYKVDKETGIGGGILPQIVDKEWQRGLTDVCCDPKVDPDVPLAELNVV